MGCNYIGRADGVLLGTRAETGQRRLRTCWLLCALHTTVDGALRDSMIACGRGRVNQGGLFGMTALLSCRRYYDEYNATKPKL